MNDILSMLRNVENSGYMAEANDTPVKGEDGQTPAAEPQDEIDGNIEDLMTKPKAAQGSDSDVVTVGSDLGLDDPDVLKAAIDLLRGGVAPSDPAMVATLANAFIALMHANASTAQRSINRLRKIYKTPLPGAD
jgi:hypothetical protein